MTERSTISSGTKGARPVFRFLAKVVSVLCLVFGVAFWILSFSEPEFIFVFLIMAFIFGHIAETGTLVNRSKALKLKLYWLARLYSANRMTLEEYGERTRKALDRAAS